VWLSLVEHLVRDEGVAGSNPATPTNISPNRSKSFPTRARPFAGAPGQISGQKRRAGLSPPPGPENDTPRAATPTPLQAIRAKCLWCCNGSAHEVALCPAKACPTWPFRFGHKPTDEIIAEQGDTQLLPVEWRMTAAQFHAGRHSALKAIRRKCHDCSGASKSEVRNCAVKDCALHSFRQGKNPNRTYSPEERGRRAGHLAKVKIAGALLEKPVCIGDPRVKSTKTAPTITTPAQHRRR
jgi:hypothetical protein